MKDQFENFTLDQADDKSSMRPPLAERMRPSNLEAMVGQQHLLGENCLLPKLIRENRLGNLILAGPPGTGKTLSLAWWQKGGCKLLVNAYLKCRRAGETLKLARYHGSQKCYLFVDEIHRFNKAARPASSRC